MNNLEAAIRYMDVRILVRLAFDLLHDNKFIPTEDRCVQINDAAISGYNGAGVN